MITVIGLGNEKDDLTQKGKRAMENAVEKGAKIVVRTALTRSYQTVQELGVEHICLDSVYQKSRSFATLAQNLAKEVLRYGENTVYLVDGSASEDYSVKALMKKTRGKVQIIGICSKSFCRHEAYTISFFGNSAQRIVDVYVIRKFCRPFAILQKVSKSAKQKGDVIEP